MATQIQPQTGSFFKEPRVFKKRFPNGFPIGPKTEKRATENKKLGKLKIRHCEIRISPYCSRTSNLSWAHSKKSRYLTTDKDWQEAARCCLPCHSVIEVMSHLQMKKCVCDAIKRRSLRSTQHDRIS